MRIIRACSEMGIETVAVYSRQTKKHCIPSLQMKPSASESSTGKDSYLNMEHIISATIA